MRRGFTLIEIISTIFIIAVLAAVAFPNYTRTVQNNEAKQAAIYLRAIRLAEKMYLAKNNTYIACANASAIRTNLGVEVSAGKWTYAVTANATTFTATATRTSDSVTITLNQASTSFGGTCSPMPTY